MPDTQEELTRQSDQLYEKYVKPLEQNHRGEFIAVSPDGNIVLAPTLLDVIKQAERRQGGGNFVFKVGDVAVMSPHVTSTRIPFKPSIRRTKTAADHEAFLSSAGGWTDLVDTAQFLADNTESRRLSTRPPVEL